jgi:hypothetical protein
MGQSGWAYGANRGSSQPVDVNWPRSALPMMRRSSRRRMLSGDISATLRRRSTCLVVVDLLPVGEHLGQREVDYRAVARRDRAGLTADDVLSAHVQVRLRAELGAALALFRGRDQQPLSAALAPVLGVVEGVLSLFGGSPPAPSSGLPVSPSCSAFIESGGRCRGRAG